MFTVDKHWLFFRHLVMVTASVHPRAECHPRPQTTAVHQLPSTSGSHHPDQWPPDEPAGEARHQDHLHLQHEHVLRHGHRGYPHHYLHAGWTFLTSQVGALTCSCARVLGRLPCWITVCMILCKLTQPLEHDITPCFSNSRQTALPEVIELFINLPCKWSH